ncbi:cyclase-like protein 2 [Hevea brasiliensis]|uniref:cyclase-like protein 2 n=1 Tax=Hevea brasiliensis TaxID=3981 RepID=UPI0025D70914|nr:cyclase-like protein 2 [Hevea brasiliensis]
MRGVQLLFLLQLCTSCVLTLAVPRVPVPKRREVYGNGRIFDITQRVNAKMPTWGSRDGLGQFVWLVASMKNGSLVNASEMKLSAHTGTHIDAPSHNYEEYYEAGFDIDTLDLEVLNESHGLNYLNEQIFRVEAC